MEDLWKVGNKLRVTTLHKSIESGGPDIYIGEVIEVDKGLALSTKDGVFRTQCTYWFGSILKQNVELIPETWLDVWNRYLLYIDDRVNKPCPDYIFRDFLKENYNPPIKKE